MNNLRYIGIIPARYASSRFPGKPLAKIGGVTMIERVWNQVLKALDNVYVATDDQRIFDAVESFGGNAVMTGNHHRSGTDRCEEAFNTLGRNADVVINIQGDEPFIDPRQIEAIKTCFDDPNVDIATLVREFNPENGYEALANPNTPKVEVNAAMYAMSFSRSVIPYIRGCEPSLWPSKHRFFTHVGMYAYRGEVLSKITRLPQSPLEIAESLEQLRWLENGFRIKVGITDCNTIGIDTPSVLEAAEKYLIKENI